MGKELDKYRTYPAYMEHDTSITEDLSIEFNVTLNMTPMPSGMLLCTWYNPGNLRSVHKVFDISCLPTQSATIEGLMDLELESFQVNYLLGCATRDEGI